MNDKMTLRFAVWLVAACFSLLAPNPAVAQGLFPSDNGKALTGITTFDARVVIVNWLNMEGDRDNAVTNLQSALELGLRRDGVIVDQSAPNYLLCALRFAQAGGIVAYTHDVEYFTYASKGVHRLEWRRNGIATVGQANAEPDDGVRQCVDSFVNEWLKWNPKSR